MHTAINPDFATTQAKNATHYWSESQLRAMQGLGLEAWCRPLAVDSPDAESSIAIAPNLAASPEAEPIKLELVKPETVKPAPTKPIIQVVAEPTLQSIQTIAQLSAQASQCTRCALHSTGCRLPAFKGAAEKASVLIVVDTATSQAPPDQLLTQDEKKLLARMLEAIHIDIRAIALTPLLKCGTAAQQAQHGVFSSAMEQCSAYWQQAIALYQPRCVLTLGLAAAQGVLGVEGEMDEFAAETHAVGDADTPLFTLEHPATLMLAPGKKAAAWQTLLQIKQVLN